MRRVIIGIGGTLIGMSLMTFAPTAHADDATFVSGAKALGFPQSSPNLISTARSTCYFLSLNRDPGEVTDRIARYLSVNDDMAEQFFAMSVKEYCP